MKFLKKRIATVAVVAAMVTALMTGIGIAAGGAASARAQTATQGYFYGQLEKDARAQSFYKAFETLAQNGTWKKGSVEYDLAANGVVSADDLAAYLNNGDTKVPKAFSTGRDAFVMDNPDLFYADLFGTSLSVGQAGGGAVAGFLDSSRTASLYTGSFNSEEAVNEAIARYESKLLDIVARASERQGAKAQVEYVNNYIAENTVYSFGTSVVDGKHVDGPEAAYISTAYGALVYGKAICGGFAKGFKAVMDRLGIPCVCVQGYSLASNASSWQPHMWNYVEVEGMWYAVDVTWNATGGDIDKWLLVGGQKMVDSHIEDGVFSSNGAEFRYPAVKPYDYGQDTDDNGMVIEGAYTESSNDTGKILTLTVSFDGKGAEALREEGKYMAVRFGDTDKDTKKVVWGPWIDSIAVNEMVGAMFVHTETESTIKLHAAYEYVQFALINRAPDESGGAFYPNEPQYGENAGKEWKYYYNSKTFDETTDYIGAPSTPYLNNAHGSYVPAPGVVGHYPSNTGSWPVDKTYSIRVVYSASLKLTEGATAQDVGMDFYTSRGNDNVKDHAIVSDVQWDGDKTITFTFTPSKMYIHNNTLYYFTPTHLVGVESDKVPDPFTYSFKGKSVVCSKVFNDGRLYMNVFGDPKMLDASDLSITDFKDENGNYYAESQRSQLLLVANKPNAAREQEMDEVLKENVPIKDEDVVSSATFEIDLQVCGVVTKIPNGSYLQVAFGFPEGFSPDDAGTTFKIYHYKHDNSGRITGVEEIPVIVTQYGLIAQVKSFSPFKIVQLKKTSQAATNADAKYVYASVNGIGGTVSAKADGKGGIDEVTGKSITYTLRAQEGYQVGSVLLNGKAVAASDIKDGKLTLKKSDLSSSNMLEVTYVTEASAKSYADKGITIMAAGAQPFVPGTAGSSKTAAIVLGCIAAIVAAGGIAVTVYMYLQSQKKSGKKKTAAAKR